MIHLLHSVIRHLRRWRQLGDCVTRWSRSKFYSTSVLSTAAELPTGSEPTETRKLFAHRGYEETIASEASYQTVSKAIQQTDNAEKDTGSFEDRLKLKRLDEGSPLTKIFRRMIGTDKKRSSESLPHWKNEDEIQFMMNCTANSPAPYESCPSIQRLEERGIVVSLDPRASLNPVFQQILLVYLLLLGFRGILTIFKLYPAKKKKQ